MGIKISLLADDGTTKPISNNDYIIMSNTDDGGTTYNVSKKILVSELLTHMGVSVSTDVVPIGTGTGIQDSNVLIKDFGTPTDIWMVASNFASTTNYFIYVDNTPVTGGQLWLNGKDRINFTVDDGQKLIELTEFVVKLAIGGSGQTVEIGDNAVPTGAKVLIVGETNDNTKAAIQIQSADLTDLMKLLNDGAFSLKSGTSVNEITTGGDYSAATDDQLPTRLDVKTFVEANTGVTAPPTSTPLGTTQEIDWDNGEGQIVDLGSATGDVTLTMVNPVAGQSYILKFIQGATPYDIVLPSTVKMAGGTAPTTLQLTVIDDAEDTLTLWFDGTNYYEQFGETYG